LLRIAYSSDERPPLPARLVDSTGALIPAGYRDQWIIEAFARYPFALSNPVGLARARERLLAESPEGGSFESLGPVWLGFRLMQPATHPGYSDAFSGKSVWILHMLRQVLQREGGASAFANMVDEIQRDYRSKPFSTFDLKRLAEKHAGKPLDWFFESWVFGTGIPAYTVEFKVEPAPAGFVISGNIAQSGVPDTFEMPVPVYADDIYLGHVTVSSDGGEFRFVTPTKPEEVLVDPRNTLLRMTNTK
jgi:aminopeptidase N